MPAPSVEAVVLTGPQVEHRPWEPLAAVGPGVSHKPLWDSGESVAGLMRLEVGGEVLPHAHRQAHHHLWVHQGRIEVLGEDLGEGSYVHVPGGVSHGIVNRSDEPATFFYLYLHPASGPGV